MKSGDLIIEYTESGDIQDLFIVIEKLPNNIQGLWTTFAVMTNRSGFWHERDVLPFYIHDWLAFELIEA